MQVKYSLFSNEVLTFVLLYIQFFRFVDTVSSSDIGSKCCGRSRKALKVHVQNSDGSNGALLKTGKVLRVQCSKPELLQGAIFKTRMVSRTMAPLFKIRIVHSQVKV